MTERQISIHALREEGDERRQKELRDRGISIHALREEGDLFRRPLGCPQSGFLSTPSARRATQFFGIGRGLFWNFYPRPPRGGRLAYGDGIA